MPTDYSCSLASQQKFLKRKKEIASRKFSTVVVPWCAPIVLPRVDSKIKILMESWSVVHITSSNRLQCLLSVRVSKLGVNDRSHWPLAAASDCPSVLHVHGPRTPISGYSAFNLCCSCQFPAQLQQLLCLAMDPTDLDWPSDWPCSCIITLELPRNRLTGWAISVPGPDLKLGNYFLVWSQTCLSPRNLLVDLGSWLKPVTIPWPALLPHPGGVE